MRLSHAAEWKRLNAQILSSGYEMRMQETRENWTGSSSSKRTDDALDEESFE